MLLPLAVWFKRNTPNKRKEKHLTKDIKKLRRIRDSEPHAQQGALNCDLFSSLWRSAQLFAGMPDSWTVA